MEHLFEFRQSEQVRVEKKKTFMKYFEESMREISTYLNNKLSPEKAILFGHC